MIAGPNGLKPERGAKVYRNARIVDPANQIDETGALIVADGVIVAAGASAASQGTPDGAVDVDCKGKTIIPGLVDMQVHTGEPGGENRETIASASRAAAAGGVTSAVVMPDTDPVIDDVALVEHVRRTARETAITRILPAAAMTKGLAGREMTEIGNLKQAGAVMLTDAHETLISASVMRRTLTYARDFSMLVSHTTHDCDLAANGVMNDGLFASWLGLAGIAREAELLPLERDLALARLTGAPYQAARISTAMSAEAIRRAKDKDLPVSAAVSINHLTLNENDIGEYRTFFKMTPPLRHEDDRRAMVEALSDGIVDVIVSAHDPQDVDTKRLPFAEAADGAVGLETLLSAGLRLVHSGDVTLSKLIAAMTCNPASLLGIEAGTLSAGRAADFAIVDLDTPWVLDPSALQSKSKNTPFEDARFTGRVVETYVAGRCVFSA